MKTHNSLFSMHRSFEDDLDKLRTRLIRMGSLVEEQVEFSFRALLEGNAEIAKIVVERDDKVDKLDLKIDKQCQRIFALQQPVASDLRLLLAAIKINNELERIGDVAAGIAAEILRQPVISRMSNELGMERITRACFRMVKASLDAFINNDPDLAKHILPTDNTVDSLERAIVADIIAHLKTDPEFIEPGVALIICTRRIERIADHATNIAENVIFMLESKLVRHSRIEDEETGSDTDIGSEE